MKKNQSYSEMLRHENEITKLKIQAEFGVELKGENNLNPAIENIWLNQILEYERAMLENKKIAVKVLLDHPQLRAVNEITDAELPLELQSLMSMLSKKSIVVESTDGIDDREMYRFIAEELLEEEVDANVPKNMITCFIYEEFHPNDENDLKRYSDDFAEALTHKDNDHWKMHLCSSEDSEESEIRIGKLERRIRLFRDAFEDLHLDEFTIESLFIGDDKADVNFFFRMSVKITGANSDQIIEGNGTYRFRKNLDYWFIEDVVMPGVV